MSKIRLKIPGFLSLEATEQKKIIENLGSGTAAAEEQETAVESLTFLKAFKTELKDPNITLKKVRALFEIYSDKLKKALLTL